MDDAHLTALFEVLAQIRVPVAFLTNQVIRILLRKGLRRDDVTIKLPDTLPTALRGPVKKCLKRPLKNRQNKGLIRKW